MGRKAKPELPLASCRACASRSCCRFGSLTFELLIRTGFLHGSECQVCPAVSRWGICCSPGASRHSPWPSLLAGQAALPSGQLEQLESRNTAAKDQSWSLKCPPCQLEPPSSTSSLEGMYFGTVCDLIYPCFFRINSDFFSFNKDLTFLSILEIIVLNGHSGKDRLCHF